MNYHIVTADNPADLAKEVRNFTKGNAWKLYGNLVVVNYGANNQNLKYYQVITQEEK